MQPDMPMLMITLQIPVAADTNAEEILDAIGQQVRDSLNAFKQQNERDFRNAPHYYEREWNSPEMQEEPTRSTERDLLSGLGYRYDA